MTNGNGHPEHIYERSQKLTEALYRVTDLFSDSEPLKWLLRRNGLDIFESLLKIKTTPANERVRGLEQVAEKIRQCVKVFELAASGSFISDANFQVLKKRYLELADYLMERKTEILPELSSLSVIGHESIGQIERPDKGHQIGQTHNLSVLALQDKPKIDDTDMNNEGIKENGKKYEDNQPHESEEEMHNHNVSGEAGENGEKSKGNGNRREEIISLIKKKDWVSVGELADVFRGKVGEKTLQRDLVSMAGEGLLLKEGEKRWRRYRLAT